MNSIPAYQSGLSGINSGLQSLNKSAATIASAGTTGADVTAPLVDMMSSKQQVQASAKILEANNSMIGSILDITV